MKARSLGEKKTHYSGTLKCKRREDDAMFQSYSLKLHLRYQCRHEKDGGLSLTKRLSFDTCMLIALAPLEVLRAKY